jgi:hypothetical protein
MLMTTNLLSFAFAALLTTSAAQAQPTRAPAPVIMIAEVDQDGGPYIEIWALRQVPETRTVAVKVGDRVVNRTETVLVPVYEKRRVALDAKDVQVFGSDGKRIKAKDVRALLKKSTAVFVSADGKEVDPLYLRLVREGGLVVVAQALVGVAPPPVVPPQRKLP